MEEVSLEAIVPIIEDAAVVLLVASTDLDDDWRHRCCSEGIASSMARNFGRGGFSASTGRADEGKPFDPSLFAAGGLSFEFFISCCCCCCCGSSGACCDLVGVSIEVVAAGFELAALLLVPSDDFDPRGFGVSAAAAAAAAAECIGAATPSVPIVSMKLNCSSLSRDIAFTATTRRLCLASVVLVVAREAGSLCGAFRFRLQRTRNENKHRGCTRTYIQPSDVAREASAGRLDRSLSQPKKINQNLLLFVFCLSARRFHQKTMIGN